MPLGRLKTVGHIAAGQTFFGGQYQVPVRVFDIDDALDLDLAELLLVARTGGRGAGSLT